MSYLIFAFGKLSNPILSAVRGVRVVKWHIRTIESYESLGGTIAI
ncbi:MAG: hypothetical protein WBE68_01875 [Candidatus Nitrosopolaris sp.]